MLGLQAHGDPPFTGTILGYLAGEIPETKLLALAKSDDADEQIDQLGEAFFYIASAKLIKGDKDAAAIYFQKCITNGGENSYEFSSAQMELKRLKGQ